MSFSIQVKQTSGRVFRLDVDPDLTIFDLKALIQDLDDLNTTPAHQTLLYNGRVCQDDNSMQNLGLKNGDTIILLRKRKRNSDGSPVSASAAAATSTEEKKEDNTTTQQPFGMQPNLFRSMAPMMSSNNGSMGMGGMDMDGMRDQLMQNPDLMKSIMDSPMFKSMLSNPNILQSMFENNPALQSLLDENPQLRHILKDPQLMQHAMRAASNPEYFNEMMKNNDRALQNIESLPGGFSALSRMYNQIQNPMERAMDDMFRQRFGVNRTVISEVDKAKGPTSDAMPNPFSSQYQQQKKAEKMQQKRQQSMNNFGQMSQPNNNLQSSNNMMNLFGNMNFNPQQSQQPSQQSQFNPFGSAMFSPFSMGSQQSQSQQQPSQPSMYGSNMNPFMFNPPPMQSSANTNINTNNSNNNINNNSNIAQQPSTNATIAQPSVTVTREEALTKYESQIAELEAMGFNDKDLIVDALIHSDGQLDDAIDFIDDKMDSQ